MSGLKSVLVDCAELNSGRNEEIGLGHMTVP